MQLIELSQEFLLTVKKKSDAAVFLERYASLPVADLKKLENDAQKMTFWINTYNAFTRYFLDKDASVLKKGPDRHRFFTRKKIRFKGFILSLDDIEHGIIRKSKIKWSKGYLPKFWASFLERSLRVSVPDPRIHFALNCGAISCPPIRFYEDGKIDEQLEMATKAFLETEVSWDAGKKNLKVSRLFSWYEGDFGGRSGVLKFIQKYRPELKWNDPNVTYSEYHWTPSSW